MELYALDTLSLTGREAEALLRLSPERRDKVLRLRDRGRHLSLGAGLLLARFVGTQPMEYGPAGKPYLPSGPFFSLSHSGSLVILAVSDREVGADTERIAPLREMLLPRVFSPEERRWLSGDPDRRGPWLWTRKEAVLKWDGCGITRPLRDFSVLPGDWPSLDGRCCALHTAEFSGYWISAAQAEDARFDIRFLDAKELL